MNNARNYRDWTGRQRADPHGYKEAWLVLWEAIRQRSFWPCVILALCTVYLACFHSYQQFLAPGERGVVFGIAKDRRQAKIILRYPRPDAFGNDRAGMVRCSRRVCGVVCVCRAASHTPVTISDERRADVSILLAKFKETALWYDPRGVSCPWCVGRRGGRTAVMPWPNVLSYGPAGKPFGGHSLDEKKALKSHDHA